MTRSTRAKWAERVRAWRATGHTAERFCEQGGLNARTLKWWGWELGRRRAARRVGAPAFIEVATAQPVDERREGAIEVVVDDRVRVRVSGAFDPAVLRRVLAALEEA